MTWHDLLFAHWPVAEVALRPHIPDRLQIDKFHDQAWIGVVPFGMAGTRLRGTPAVPGLSAFLEINVRTYVVADGKPGVWFFSLDAANWFAVRGARTLYHLMYYDARMTLQKDADGWIRYRSQRTHRGAGNAEFAARYRATGEAFEALPGSLDAWLTNRYCLYAADRRGRVFRGEIDHPPWPLQPAEAQWECNTMTTPLGIPLPDTAPLLHFSQRLDVVGWGLERLTHSAE